jgi:hypothetical protein
MRMTFLGHRLAAIRRLIAQSDGNPDAARPISPVDADVRALIHSLHLYAETDNEADARADR